MAACSAACMPAAPFSAGIEPALAKAASRRSRGRLISSLIARRTRCAPPPCGARSEAEPPDACAAAVAPAPSTTPAPAATPVAAPPPSKLPDTCAAAVAPALPLNEPPVACAAAVAPALPLAEPPDACAAGRGLRCARVGRMGVILRSGAMTWRILNTTLLRMQCHVELSHSTARH